MRNRQRTCQTIIDILKNFFANAPLKSRAQRRPPPDTDSVRQVTKKLAALARQRSLTRGEFEQGVLEAVTKLRDVHTAYTLSTRFNRRIFFLPFLLKRWQDGPRDRYVVTRVDKQKLKQGKKPSKLRQGAEVTHWNGKPIA